MDTQLKIAYSMIRIMANKNILDITMSDIQNDAEVSRATLYRYFKSKKQIIDYLQNLFVRKTINAFNDQYRRVGLPKLSPLIVVELTIVSIIPICYNIREIIKIINYHGDLEYWNANIRNRYVSILKKALPNQDTIQIEAIINFFMITLFTWNEEMLVMPVEDFQKRLKILFPKRFGDIF